MNEQAAVGQVRFDPPRLSKGGFRKSPFTNSAQNRHATDALEALLSEYSACPRPLDVSFRQLVGPIPVTDLSHSIYPYPARLLRQIPRFFLHCEQIARPEDVVLDPFCGSGTVLVEARAAGLTGWGIDSNPFARLLSEVKTTPLESASAEGAANEVLSRAKKLRSSSIPDVVNVNLWFTSSIKKALGRINKAITEVELPPALRRYLLVSLALTAERCSLRDPRIPVPVRRDDWQLVASKWGAKTVWQAFSAATLFLAERLATVPSPEGIESVVDGDDAVQASAAYWNRLAHRLKRPNLILTSPPYGAAQKYIRSSSLAIGWTNLAPSNKLADLERRLIGREHLRRRELDFMEAPNTCIAQLISHLSSRDRVRAAIYAHYFNDMNAVFASLVSLLAPGGFLVLIAGSNAVADVSVQTHRHLKDLAVEHGMKQVLELRDTIRGRVLLTKRAMTSVPLKYEAVHVLRKIER